MLHQLDVYKYLRMIIFSTRIKYFQKKSNTYLRDCDSVSSYNFTYLIAGSKIQNGTSLAWY